MKKTGFTLIELLAVIVILAIIALIAVPIVINIINDSKKESISRSIDLYMDHVQKAITKEQMNNPSFNPETCEIKPEGILECNNGTKTYDPIKVELKGKMPESGTVTINNNKLKFKNIIFNNKIYYESYANLILDNNSNGKPFIGDKYTYKVNDKDEFNFYVLSIEGDEVNLIMDRNICEDGKEATSSNICAIAWYSLKYDNKYGPITAMQGLYNATKEWKNVPDINLSENKAYSDEGYLSDNDSGYDIMETTLNGIKFMMKNGLEVTGENNQIPVIIYEDNKPLKARLPKIIEVYSDDDSNPNYCHYGYGSCPYWLTNGLEQYSTYYPDNEYITGIRGYWTLSSYYLWSSSYARLVSYCGYIDFANVSASFSIGIRPVITVPLSDLQ